ncbi:ankyrin repeat-containing domain protein [Mycena galopus ATCC 62051]|nr:ankyrin repeat-containing domain protein [Mycena galopus ATCC 62051]
MSLLEERSSQHALYRLYHFNRDNMKIWEAPIPSPLWMCSEMGYTEGVHSLLIKHNAFINQTGEYNQSALHVALREGNLDVAQLLIEHNAAVNQAMDTGVTALHQASEKGHFNIAKLLIEGNAALNHALHFAMTWGHLNIVQLLIKHNASINQATDDGWTALHLASNNGHFTIAQLLIEHNASVNLTTADGPTALEFGFTVGPFRCCATTHQHCIYQPSHQRWQHCIEYCVELGSSYHCVSTPQAQLICQLKLPKMAGT